MGLLLLTKRMTSLHVALYPPVTGLIGVVDIDVGVIITGIDVGVDVLTIYE